MVNEKSVPTGVKVISVFYYIGAAFGILFGLLLLIGSGIISSLLGSVLGVLGAGLFIFAGLILLALGVFGIFIGRGLWKARHWARVVAIIFACLGILMAVIIIALGGSIASNLFNLIIQGIIGGYLFLNKSVKQAFA